MVITVCGVGDQPLAGQVGVLAAQQVGAALDALARNGNAQDLGLHGTGIGLAVDGNVLHNGIFPVQGADVGADVGDLHVAEHQAGDGHFIEGFHEDAVLAAAAGQVLDGDVLELGQVIAVTAHIVQHGGVHDRVAHGLDLGVAQVDVLHRAAALGVGLEAQGVVQVGAVEGVVVGKQVLDAAAHLTAAGNAAVAVCEGVVADDEVLGRMTGSAQLTAIAVAACLDGDAVVTGVEVAVLDQNVVAVLGVTAVVVVAVGVDGDAAGGKVGAQHRVQLPHGRVGNGNALYQHVGALDGLVEVGAQVVALTKHTVLGRGAVVGHLAQKLDIVVAGLGDAAIGVDGTGPVPPVVLVGLAVQGALAGQSNVLLLVSVDQGAPVVQLGAFVVGKDQGVVCRGDVLGEPQDRVLILQVQVHVALEGDGTYVVDTRGDDDGAAAPGTGLVNGTLDGCGVQLSVVGDSTVVQNAYRIIGEHRVGNVGEDLLSHIPGQVVGVGSSRGKAFQAVFLRSSCVGETGEHQCSRGCTGRGKELAASELFHAKSSLAYRQFWGRRIRVRRRPESGFSIVNFSRRCKKSKKYPDFFKKVTREDGQSAEKQQRSLAKTARAADGRRGRRNLAPPARLPYNKGNTTASQGGRTHE